MAAEVLFFALDSCDAEVATALAAAGRMPVLSRLLAAGTSMPTRVPDGSYISSVWPTIATGLTPEHHQYSCWAVIDPATYEMRQTTPNERRGTPIWTLLSAVGRRVAVLDAPHFPADPAINGLHLAEWGDHVHHVGLHSAPPELADEVVSRFGAHEVGSLVLSEPVQYSPCDWMHGGPWGRRDLAQTRALVDDLHAGLARKADVSAHYLSTEQWDLYFTVFTETHCAGHQLWHLHDPTHTAHDPSIAADVGDPLADVYTHVDDALGHHLAALDDDTVVLVHLTHGFGPFYGATHLVDDVLRRLATADEDSPRGSTAAQAAKWLWSRSPRAARRVVAPAVTRALRSRSQIEAPALPVGAEQRATQPFYAAPNNDACAGIRLNVVGREAHGVVARDDYDPTCAALAAAFSDLVNVGTGRPAVQRMEMTGPLEGRPTDDVRADIYVEWDRSAPMPGVWSPTVGVIMRAHRHVRSGDHRPDGLLISVGGGIPRGTVLDPVGVEDIAPTIAALLDVEMPGVDGRPIAGITAANRKTRSP